MKQILLGAQDLPKKRPIGEQPAAALSQPSNSRNHSTYLTNFPSFSLLLLPNPTTKHTTHCSLTYLIHNPRSHLHPKLLFTMKLRSNFTTILTLSAAMIGTGVISTVIPAVARSGSVTATIDLAIIEKPKLPDFSNLPRCTEGALDLAGILLTKTHGYYGTCLTPSQTGDWYDYKCLCKGTGGDGKGSAIVSVLLENSFVWVQCGWDYTFRKYVFSPCLVLVFIAQVSCVPCAIFDSIEDQQITLPIFRSGRIVTNRIDLFFLWPKRCRIPRHSTIFRDARRRRLEGRSISLRPASLHLLLQALRRSGNHHVIWFTTDPGESETDHLATSNT